MPGISPMVDQDRVTPREAHARSGAPRSAFDDLAAAKASIVASWREGGDHFPCLIGLARDLRDSWDIYPESFTAMVVADLFLGQPEHRSLVHELCAMLERELGSDGSFHFFKDHERLPADVDSTALGLSVLLRSGAAVGESAHRALDRIVANMSEEGVIAAYVDPTAEHEGAADLVASVNALYLAFMLGRERELAPALALVRARLIRRAYGGGRYHSPDALLYFTARLVRRFPAAREQLLAPLVDALRERQGTSEHPLDLAMRVIASRWLCIDDAGESRALMATRRLDGRWPADSLICLGRKPIFFGSRVLTTAFAVRALRALATGPAARP